MPEIDEKIERMRQRIFAQGQQVLLTIAETLADMREGGENALGTRGAEVIHSIICQALTQAESYGYERALRHIEEMANQPTDKE